MSGTDRVVFWDFDGTLARRHDLWSGALLDAWRIVDPTTPVTVDQLRPFLRDRFPWHNPAAVRTSQSAEEWWAALRPTLVAAFIGNGLDPVRAEAAASHVSAQFYRPDAWTLIDGATEALARTQGAGYRNVILSNHPPELPLLVDALGLSDFLDRTITSAVVGAEKPNPVIFDYAMGALGIGSTNHVWMVGDNPIADIQGATDVGIRAILADGAYPDSVGTDVLNAAQQIIDAP